MIICPTIRDHRELKMLGLTAHNFLSHNYASAELEFLTADEQPSEVLIDDPEAEIERIVQRCSHEKVEALASTDDYPGATLTSIVAQHLNLPGVRPTPNLLCQHKYYSRLVQQAAVPEAVPAFHLLDVSPRAVLPPGLEFPVFVKPAKSFFSVGAQRVDSADELRSIQLRWRGMARFFRPFDTLLRRYTGHAMGTEFLIAETLLKGWQVTLDGYAHNGEIYLMGVVDSIMFPGTIAFQRFEYPSVLPQGVQDRMFQIAAKVMRRMEFDCCQFNIEFMYDTDTDRIWIIEINPRMSSQFADLFEKVDGTNSYTVMLDLALGREPHVTKREGRYRMAASCVLRTFQNQMVVKLPTQMEIDKIFRLYSDIRVEILGTEGLKLSQQMQDTCSYRYGLLNIGGRDRQEILSIFDECTKALPFHFEPV
jgi:biotin carboxylase